MSETVTPSHAGKSRVRIARELKGLTQAQLAQRVGYHIETVKAWDQGKHKPGSPEAAQQLADVLERPLEWLFPPDEHIYVRDARTRYPTACAPPRAASAEIADPRDVLATRRPRGPVRRVRLAPALALLATAVALAATVLLATGSRDAARPGAKTGSATALTPVADAVNRPASTERAAIIQAKQARKHARRAPRRTSRHRAANRFRRRGPIRSTQPTYTPPAIATPASRPVATPNTGTRRAVASSTTVTTAATTVQQPASAGPNRPAAAAPDGPSEFGGP